MSSEKLNVARLKRFGKKFEVSIDPQKAQAFKQGELSSVSEALHAEHIYADAHKGQLISDTELQEAFETTDVLEVAARIIKEGEVQLSADQRNEQREQRFKQLITYINQNAVDPKTKLPHPATRIEAALKEAKVHLSEHKTVQEQIPDILSKLRPILPISIEKKEFTFTLPADLMGKCYQYVKNNSNLLKEEWTTNGKWKATCEVPAGLYTQFVATLQETAHGAMEINNE